MTTKKTPSTKTPLDAAIDKVATAVGAAEETPQAAEPGALRSVATMTIHTAKAQMMIHGRRGNPDTKTHPIVGLTRFGATARSIWNAARADDPYADAWLLRVEEVLDDTNKRLRELLNQVNNLLQRRPDVHIGVGQSNSPVEIPLTFANPYGFQAAYLLSDFDELARAILTAKHVALVPPQEAEKMLSIAFKAMRGAYESCSGYRFMGITRDDVTQGTARGKQAVEAMGTLDQDILAGTKRARFAPERAETRPRKPATVKRAISK